MSAYSKDGRVTVISRHHFEVTTPDGRATVSAFMSETDWWIDTGRMLAPAPDGSDSQGPFAAADEAIRHLIGDPR